MAENGARRRQHTALAPPYIERVPPDDPQPNPPNDRSAIHFVTKRLTAEEETKAIVDSLGKWLPKHQDSTVAVLVPRNTRGVEVIDRIMHGIDREQNLQLLEDLCDTMLNGSLCGLGGMTPFPVQSVLKHFKQDFLKTRLP